MGGRSCPQRGVGSEPSARSLWTEGIRPCSGALNERVSLGSHAYRSIPTIVTLTLDWDRATFHPIDDRTLRLEVPFPQKPREDARTALASALVGLEEVGGPIENATLSGSHIRMEISRAADVEAIKQRVQALVDDLLSSTGETSI